MRISSRASLRWGLPLISVMAAVCSIVLAGTFVVFGPETFQPTLGAGTPQTFTRTFPAPPPTAASVYNLHLVNGGSGLSRVSSCSVTINGKVVVQSTEITTNVATLDKSIALATSNTMSLQIAGASGSGITVTISGTDNTAPTITATTSPLPNAAGWNKTDVTVTFTCQDAGSGIASCTAPVTKTTDGANQTVTGTAVDKAGNTATKTVTLNIDKTAPVVTMTRTPAANAAGWNNTNVTVSFACSDPLSGLTTSCPAATTVSKETAGQVVSATATDKAGNTTTASTTVKLDKTAPTLTTSKSPAANAAGWNNTNVVLSYSCTDALSGVPACPAALTVSTEGAGQVKTATATDAAGNTSATSTVTLNIDKTPPVVTASKTPAANAAGWNNTNVTVSFACSDALSGLTTTCPASTTVSTETAGQVVGATATDKAGNTTTASSTVKLDKTAPILATSQSPAANAAGWNNTNVVLSYTCTDSLSGVPACPAALTVSTEGAGQVKTATATDAAGNTSATSTVTLNIDKTPPTVTASQSPAANAAGWNNSNVTVSFVCSDALSGLIGTCPASTTVSTETAGQVVSGVATDRAGNTATASATVKLDKTPPTISAASSPTPNANGWNNTDVVLTYSCQDALSGVPSCPAPVTVSSEGAGQVQTTTATDSAGNSATSTVTVNIDKTPPTITAQIAPPPNAAGWNNSDATVSFTVADTLSGVAGSVSPVTVTTEGANQSIPGSVSDRAGNTASATASVSLDKTPPILSITAPTGTITNTPSPPVRLQYADGFSGVQTGSLQVSIDNAPLSGCATDPASATCATPNLLSGPHSVTASLADLAQNPASASQTFQLVLVTPLDVAIAQPITGFLTNAAFIQVSGTVSAEATAVFVNGYPAALASGTFTVANLPLVEGNNTITAVATNSSSGIGTSSVTIVRDSTPPKLAIEFPASGQTVTTETIPVIGLVNDVVTGTVSAENCRVTVSSRAGTAVASVSNRSFMIEAFPLVPGPNTLTAIAIDTAGNAGVPFQVQVTRQVLAGQKISAPNQATLAGVVGTPLSMPLVALLTSASGPPVPGRNVVFQVTRGDGTLAAGDVTGRTLTVVTGPDGQAQVNFTLGSRSGVGNQRVVATSPGFAGEAEFMVSALASAPAAIKTYTGEVQTGAAGRPLPDPFIVFVHDSMGNPVYGVPVTFEVATGGGSVGGGMSLVVPTDSDGRASVVPVLGPNPGVTNNMIEASFAGMSGNPARLVASGLALGPAEATRVSGVVLDNSNRPVPGVTIKIEGSFLQTTTDDMGQFTIPGAPVGTLHLQVDATTASLPGTWPMLIFKLTTVSGQDNTVGMPIFVVALDSASSRLAGGSQDVTLTMANVPGASLTIFANSVTCPDGGHQCNIMLSQVHSDKVPMPPLEGQAPSLVWTIQPPGARFNPPARMAYPNVDGLPPGAVVEISSFDHDLGQYISVGTATVSEDGSTITSDPGGGIIHAGWHFPYTPPNPNTCPALPCAPERDPDPEDCYIPVGGDPCDGVGCHNIVKGDDENCGALVEQIKGIDPPEFWSRYTCKFCRDGNCLFGRKNPPPPNDCGQEDTPATYRCIADNVFQRYANRDADVRRFEEGVHPGVSENIMIGCGNPDTTGSTRETCFPVSQSFHYCGRSLDFGIHDLCAELSQHIAAALKAARFSTGAKVHDELTKNEHIHTTYFPPGSTAVLCRGGQLCDVPGYPACLNCSWKTYPGAFPPDNSCGVTPLRTAGQLKSYYLDCGPTVPPHCPPPAPPPEEHP